MHNSRVLRTLSGAGLMATMAATLDHARGAIVPGEYGQFTYNFGPQAAARENGTDTSMMTFSTTMLGYLSTAPDQETTTCLNPDMHGHRRSLPQSNVAAGQSGFSQTVDYLAKRNPRSTRSMMATVQRMTVIVVSSNSSDTKTNRRMDELTYKGGCQTTGGIPTLP